jgi:hypothetical protein
VKSRSEPQRKDDTAVDLKTQEVGVWGEVAF